MNSAKLTIRLSSAELEFAKDYAKDHGISLTSLIHRFLDRLRTAQRTDAPPEIAGIAGLVPPRTNARREYVARTEAKHR